MAFLLFSPSDAQNVFRTVGQGNLHSAQHFYSALFPALAVFHVGAIPVENTLRSW